MLVVIPCGGKKLNRVASAGLLYIGPYHRACRTYADSLGGDVIILSAKFGLVWPDELLEPYNLRMGQRGCISVETACTQAERLGLLGRDDVVALGGRNYTDVCRQIWPNCVTPLAGVGGIGRQLQWLKKHTTST